MSILIDNYQYEDEQYVINRFKELIHPSNEKSYSNRSYNNEFIVITKYLGEAGYQIKQFPDILAHPCTLETFAYDQVRSYIQTRRSKMGTVTWDERRKLISELNFSRRNSSVIEMPNDMQRIIKSISVRDSEWESQSDNEKLRTIADLIENLLKQPNGSFITLPDNVFYGFFSNDLLKELRKQLQIFRHSNKEAIESRKNFKEDKKQFLIHFGVVLVIRINEALKEEKIGF